MKSVAARVFAAIGTGLVTALVAAVLGGWLADTVVGWYRISSMEGASGYFVVFLALFGFMAGFVLGFVLSIMLSRKPGGGLRALWIAPLATVACIAAIGVASRFLADIPPRFQGEELFLALELSWPLAEAPKRPEQAGQGGWKVELYSTSGDNLRLGVAGPVWIEDARTEEGRLVVPATVEVFTSRGKRLLLIHTGKDRADGFQVPLPAFPGSANLAWSEWLPRAGAGSPPLPDGLRYRFRIVPRSEPVRSDVLGPFLVETHAHGFHQEYVSGGPQGIRVNGRFRVRYLDQPVTAPAELGVAEHEGGAQGFQAVALVRTEPEALVVQSGYAWNGGPVFLLTGSSDGLSWTPLGRLPGNLQVHPLNGERGRDAAADGRVDRLSFGRGGIHAVANSVLDTRNLEVQAMDDARLLAELDQYRALSLSPDGRRFARMIRSRSEVHLVEVDIARAQSREIPFAQARIPSGAPEDADAAWFEHYFDWACAEGESCTVVARDAVAPLPRRGRLVAGDGYGSYVLQPAGSALRDALVGFLVEDLGGRRLQPEYEGDVVRVSIDDAILSFSPDQEMRRLSVWSSSDPSDRTLIRVAERIDDALSAGRFDSDFIEPMQDGHDGR